MAKGNDAYRTISEVAKWLGTQSHVLRYWESKFDQVQPMKSSGGRRYYRPDDMQLLGGIKHLLHGEGMTIKGVQQLLDEKGPAHIAALSPVLDLPPKDSKSKKATKPERDLSGQTRADNVIAFTIDPLPIRKKKQPSAQESLFPDLDQATQEHLPLTPKYLAPDQDKPVEEAPMLNLFDDEPAAADLFDHIPEPVAILLPRLPKKSDFTGQPGILSKLMALSHADRVQLLAKVRGDLGAAIPPATGTQ